MPVSKKICPVHRFSYSSDRCPFCEKERIGNMARKFMKAPGKKEEDRGISQSDLEKLMEKFNKKK